MKRHLGHINPVGMCCAIAVMLTIAYGIWGYLDYFVPRVSVDSVCSRDSACIEEITAEGRADFVALNILMPFVFVMSFGSLLLGLGIIVAIFDRWGWRT
jgi:hypothetical protein